MKNSRLQLLLLSALIASASGLVHADDASTAASSSGGSTPSASGTSSTGTSSGTGAAGGTTGATGADTAREALKQKEGDATSEKNLQEVFQAAEKTYSLLKKGNVALQYSLDYSYFRDSRIDIAIANNSSSITRFRIEEDAQHTFTNNFDLSYGVRDNLTLNTSLPLVSKFDTQSNLQTTGLGDISIGLRWQPVPLKRGLPTTTLFGSLSTATGDSPYNINVNKDLATGKGYYAGSVGASMSKVADPIVLFASGSYTVSTPVSGLNQLRGSRILTSVRPGDSLGFSMGMAYSLNYDVSLTSSFQQSYSFSSTYNFANGEYVSTAPATSASLNFSLGLRTNPQRIINISLGYGLTPDTPDVTLGFSMPIDFLGSSAD